MAGNREIALHLAAAGLFIFPVNARSRRPVHRGWQRDSSSDAATIARWWQQYPRAVPSLDLARRGLVVLDGDRHAPGVDGVGALRGLLAGSDVAAVPMVRTPRDGVHVYFRQPNPPIGNGRGDLPRGVDVRGAGGFVVAPGAELTGGRGYRPIEGQPELAGAFRCGAIPVLPPALVALLAARTRAHASGSPSPASATPPSARERAYAKATLRNMAAELATEAPGGRNQALNRACFVLGTMVARDWLTRDEVENALTAAMHQNGYAADKGAKAIAATLASGLNAGMARPHDDLPERGITLDDFVSHAPSRTYFFLPCREPWPGASVNSRLPKVEVATAAGESKEISPSAWLDVHRSVEQVSWAPGEPMLIPDRLFIASGGWIDRPGVQTFNLYRPPMITEGNALAAELWIDHVHLIYPNDAEHIIRWLAHRVQRPAEKINHALVLGGAQGIGKDTLLEPARQAVGAWNMAEISPVTLLGRFNGFLRSVILFNRYAFYERLKAFSAAPPDGLRVDEKNLREYVIVNCCGIVITTNHRTDSVYLPADDRRHYVAWSEATQGGFVKEYWPRLWGFYDAGGLAHVAAYLAELDLAKFNPKAPPPKTPAFWDIVDAGRAPEDAELADVLDALGNPDAVTLGQLRDRAGPGLAEWLGDRGNRRAIPHRMNSCGYVAVRYPGADDGLWQLRGGRQAIYAREQLAHPERLAAATQLAKSRGGRQWTG
jgi:hypothetical protein